MLLILYLKACVIVKQKGDELWMQIPILKKTKKHCTFQTSCNGASQLSKDFIELLPPLPPPPPPNFACVYLCNIFNLVLFKTRGTPV